MIATRAGVRRVDADGIALWGLGDRAIDVLFDGRRVWSFWLRARHPDHRSRGLVGRLAGALTKFLDGQTRLTVTEHVTGRVLFDQELSFGTATKRIEIVGRSGAPISLRQVRPDQPDLRHPLGRGRRAPAQRDPDRPRRDRLGRDRGLLGLRHVAGRRPRETLPRPRLRRRPRLRQRVSNPCDVVRESFRLQRVDRTSAGSAPTATAAPPSASTSSRVTAWCAGSTSSAGFVDESPTGPRLYLMGEVGADFRREWVYPLTTCTLEGRPSRPPPSPSGCWRRCTGRRGRSRPRLPVHDLRAHRAPADRLVPRVRRSTGPPGSAPTAATAAG